MRRATVNEICDAIKHKLEAFDDLRATATEPDLPNFPNAYPRLVDATTTDFDGDQDYTFDIWVATSLSAGFGSAQTQLLAYLSPAGQKSIQSVLEADPTLGGTVRNLWVQAVGPPGRGDLAGLTVLTGNVRLVVYA
jgi:hypothetical protein